VGRGPGEEGRRARLSGAAEALPDELGEVRHHRVRQQGQALEPPVGAVLGRVGDRVVGAPAVERRDRAPRRDTGAVERR
jgi:hypothetical protein